LNKYEALFIDEDDVCLGSPRQKFFDIIFNANRNLVEQKIDDVLAKCIVMEDLLEKKGISIEEIEREVCVRTVEDKKLEDEKMSLYIELTGEIVTQNE
jgi:hypothetical protein